MTGRGLNVYVPPDWVGSVMGRLYGDGEGAGFASGDDETKFEGLDWPRVEMGGRRVKGEVAGWTTRGDGMVEGTRAGVVGEKSRGRSRRGKKGTSSWISSSSSSSSSEVSVEEMEGAGRD
jgi:hypothetical protein